jgi:glycosyltransferase involved in cell wall biosynthesis
MTKLEIQIARLKEWLLFDSSIARFALAWACIAGSRLLLATGKEELAFKLLAMTHRANLAASATRHIESLIFRVMHTADRSTPPGRLKQLITNYPFAMPIPSNLQRYVESPATLLRGNILVLKSPSQNEKGAIYLYYSYIYPLFMRLFDTSEIEKKYHIVVEPSWSGYCDLNLLCLTALKSKVVVGSIEPYDSQFIANIDSNLTTAEFSGNTWVDSEKFFPIENTQKEYDLIYIASWGSYKRHWALFKALKRLRQQGKALKVVLVGYKIDLTSDKIRGLASSMGILDQITIFENIDAGKVNELLNKSRINILWSRKEGVNRAIIEGMMANVPCIVRKGFNYGHAYHYINPKTGRFSSEEDLPQTLIDMLGNLESFSPRAYVIDKMTPDVSTQKISEKLKEIAQLEGLNWTQDIAVRTSSLSGLDYKIRDNWQRFEPDFLFLEKQVPSANKTQ